MKKFFTSLMLALATIVPLQAVETDSHDNRLFFAVGESDDITQVPLLLHLENPSIGITAVEMYFSLPDGVTVVSSELTSRCATTHEVFDGETPRGYFVSVSSETIECFTENEGAVCTLLCDFSALNDGNYTISASGVFAVGVNGDEVTCYTAADQTDQYTKGDGTITGIETVTPDTSTGVLEIYNLQGIRLREPQKGTINIINGKKVIVK